MPIRAFGLWRPGWYAALAACLALSFVEQAVVGAPPPVPMPPEEVMQRWADGPVRYLMTTQENEEVREIHSIPQLSEFITLFWARRDPTPGTFQNEWRQEFWRRVLEAKRRFGDSVVPGWKTDMGKVFILLGEPNDVQSDQAPKIGLQDEDPKDTVAMTPESGPRDTIALTSVSGATLNHKADAMEGGARGIERWTYRRQYSKAAAPEYVVAFVRDQSMDWKLSSDPRLLEPSFPGSSTSDPRDPAFGGITDAFDRKDQRAIVQGYVNSQGPVSGGKATTVAAATRSLKSAAGLKPVPVVSADASLLASYDLGLELAVASNAQLLLGTITTKEFLSAFGCTAAFEYFRARDGSTFVKIGAVFSAKELYGDLTTGMSSLRVYAAVAPVSDAAHPRWVSNETGPALFDLATGASPGGLVDVWTALALPAGRYTVSLAVEDSLTGKLGKAQAEAVVPDYSGAGLSLSSPLLVANLSEIEEGRLGMDARVSGIFKRSETFGLYYEVYGLSAGQGGGLLFDATYRFFREEGASSEPLGKPVVLEGRTEAIQGWSIPLEKWPVGRYRIELRVSEAGGESVTTQASFTVVD